jgi:transglutaminase-like putative cysteine protease
MASANVTIRDVRAISYMKVRVAARPSGLWLTPEMLNVPGQRFTGTVRENVVEGEFEIEHARYDGAHAPPFPPDLGGDASLKRFLGADDYIQAGDPVLAAQAREITDGARDSWDAARRLSAWVAVHIKGAIPGGVTARGTFDQGAGDCGGHSFLLAALCRSVGIPARVVWGCLYTPHQDGAFGQHAWNEVYMGAAGWIPLDTTASEVDYVDSGHLRIGVFGSVATSMNMRSIEILDYRGAGRGNASRHPASTSRPR